MRPPGGWPTAVLWLVLGVAVAVALGSALTAPQAPREAPLTVWAPGRP
jgi:hypothetical protein